MLRVKCLILLDGGVPEWSNGAVSKTAGSHPSLSHAIPNSTEI